MLRWLAALAVIVPIIEIVLIIFVGRQIGAWQTVALLLLAGAAGIFLARREGAKTWRLARLQLSSGQMPPETLLDGVCILAGGALLVIPGFLSDVAGLLLLFPPTRTIAKAGLIYWFRKQIDKGHFRMYRR